MRSAQFLEHGHPVLFRHHHVHNHGIGCVRLKKSHALDTVLGGYYRVACVFKLVLQRHEQKRVVLGDQYCSFTASDFLVHVQSVTPSAAWLSTLHQTLTFCMRAYRPCGESAYSV